MIQLGFRNEEIVKYAKEDVLEIEDISKYVNQQYQHVLTRQLHHLVLPEEKLYIPKDKEAIKRLRLDID